MKPSLAPQGEYAWRQWDRAVIDLDAIKAQGLNSAEHSRELLRAHQQRMHAEFEREVGL